MSFSHSLLKEVNMSNLGSAKTAIRAEIEHAKKGVAYYQSLVATLEQALSNLDSVGSEQTLKKGASLKASEVKVSTGARRGRKPGSGRKGWGGLPFTGKDFWPSLITEQPRSAPEILQAAIEKLGISPSEVQKKKLSQRATFA